MKIISINNSEKQEGKGRRKEATDLFSVEWDWDKKCKTGNAIYSERRLIYFRMDPNAQPQQNYVSNPTRSVKNLNKQRH